MSSEFNYSEGGYNIPQFAADDPKRFLELIEYLNPRDQEMLICYALLGKRPTDLSILFGKAGHRAEENLHKAAHKLAGIIEFGALPEIARITPLVAAVSSNRFGKSDLAIAIWQYARCRDFNFMARLLGMPGLRQEMLRTFKRLHAAKGREAGLLAGWILWLVDGANPRGAGWAKNKRNGRYRLGPTVFRTFKAEVGRLRDDGHGVLPRTSTHGGRGQRSAQVKVKRRYNFLLRGMNG